MQNDLTALVARGLKVISFRANNYKGIYGHLIFQKLIIEDYQVYTQLLNQIPKKKQRFKNGFGRIIQVYTFSSRKR